VSFISLCVCFQLLELTENYTPEVSEYKVSDIISDLGGNELFFHAAERPRRCALFQEGKIVSFDLTTKQIELLVLNNSRGRHHFTCNVTAHCKGSGQMFLPRATHL